MSQASAQKKRPQAHCRRRLVFPAWEAPTFTSYALGGKGHGVMRLAALGLPVPAAIVVSTTLCRSYLNTGQMPSRFSTQLERELKALEEKTGKRFGDPLNPLLVSVRSGAMISMPGMMETVLNVGLTDDVATALRARYGDRFVNGCLRHLNGSLDAQMGTMLATRADLQLRKAVRRVLESWNSPEAQAYRCEYGIADALGTAIVIQEMVFGNAVGAGESGTGVVMSHNPETAKPGIYGNYLPRAQGHDLVSGETTPGLISELALREPALVAELEQILTQLQQETSYPVEVEFTIENGRLYLLQFRRAKLSPEATAIYLVREKHAGRMSREAVLEAVTKDLVEKLTAGARLGVAADDLPPGNKIGSGVGITHGAAYGEVATTPEEVATCRKFGKPYILVRRETTPEDFPLMLGAAGIITAEGGETCHAAVVARHQGIPAVIGVGEEVYDRLTNPVGCLFPVTLDAYSGTIWDNQLPLLAPQYGKEIGLLMKWWKKARGQPVIKPELCSQRFATNTALNNFYLAEAMLAECTDDALVAKIRQVHQQLTTETSAVFSTYLVLAVASEVTYTFKERNAIDEIDPELCLPLEVATAFDQLRRDFTLKHRDSWGALSAPAIAHELASVKPALVRDFLKICRRVFAEGNWRGSIGGVKWAAIAEVGELYWNGDIAAETFVDRVFDLRHNTATVLNKHPMVYSDNTGFYLTRQLDAKRQRLSVSRKWKALLALHNHVNPQLRDLYLEGQQKGLWKE